MVTYTDLAAPVYPENFNFSDTASKTIAEYLFTGLNETFYNALRGNIVKSYRHFNDIYPPLTDFPLLKVYPTQESGYTEFSREAITQYTIDYIMAFPKLKSVPDVSVFVAKEIKRLLLAGSYGEPQVFQLDPNSRLNVSYDTAVASEGSMYNQATVFRYVTVNTGFYTYA